MGTNPTSALHPNVAHYWRLINAFNTNDLATVSELLDPEIVYTIPGRSPIAGRTSGVMAHLAALRAARERSGDTLRLDATVVSAEGDHVFVYGRITAMRGEKALSSDHLVLYRFRNGRIVEGRTVPTDLYAFDEFWA